MRVQSYPHGIRARAGETLTLEQIQQYVPSLFAEHPHSSRSDRYVHISSRRVMEGLMREGFLPVEARQGRTRDEGRRGFTKHAVRFIKQGDVRTERRIGDVSFEVLMRNAHDGSAAYDFMAGLFRLACLNGMTVADSEIASVHVRHVGDEQKIMTEVIEGAETVAGQADIALEAPRKWSGIDLSQDERLALAESARVARFADSEGSIATPITAQQLLIPRRPADDGTDLWRTFNVLQENTVRGGLVGYRQDIRGRMRRSTTREIQGVDQDIKLNKQLWSLASEVAKLHS